nr:hypothetical protein Iba_chr02dCG4440 [Ipomoea batatas]GMC66625.1 hypothetical protein Iba_chr02eCG7460 [Ipomoea batatas]
MWRYRCRQHWPQDLRLNTAKILNITPSIVLSSPSGHAASSNYTLLSSAIEPVTPSPSKLYLCKYV